MKAEEFQKRLSEEVKSMLCSQGYDDGQYNEGVTAGFELGADWTYELLKGEPCQHPWDSVLGDGKIRPAKCMKCGETLH